MINWVVTFNINGLDKNKFLRDVKSTIIQVITFIFANKIRSIQKLIFIPEYMNSLIQI